MTIQIFLTQKWVSEASEAAIEIVIANAIYPDGSEQHVTPSIGTIYARTDKDAPLILNLESDGISTPSPNNRTNANIY